MVVDTMTMSNQTISLLSIHLPDLFAGILDNTGFLLSIHSDAFVGRLDATVLKQALFHTFWSIPPSLFFFCKKICSLRK